MLSTAGARSWPVGYLLADGLFPVVDAVWQAGAAQSVAATGLEWMTPSPPPTYNFEETPVVTWEAYDYDDIPAPEEVTA